jgi:hypothetical protein
MNRGARIVVVTGGLILTGAIVGTLCAYVALALLLAPTEGSTLFADADLFWISAVFGGVLGAISAPVVFWALLRFVPLGRAVAWCAVGSILGRIAAWLVGSVLGAVAGALAGFVGTAPVLRRTVPNAVARR